MKNVNPWGGEGRGGGGMHVAYSKFILLSIHNTFFGRNYFVLFSALRFDFLHTFTHFFPENVST
jgi:hypothetical protein